MKFTVCLCCILIAVSSKAQEIYQFKQIACNFPEVKECTYDKLLGETLSVKLEQFRQVYTKNVNCGPPSYTASLEIRKPDLYYSIEKLTHHFRKCKRKETLSQEKIEKDMVDIINKSIVIFNQETDSIEEELRQANNSEEIIGVFDRIVIQ
ncbi:hypothetical protein [Sunxiuqinia elliptica]|uniref:Secreted protein n=1 Tax=Sunxiuqinia elliptica TaxID=655355 RepID=A0A1I2GWN6_9BACT|nr:hypothetical protein [Sunxiuqinia elliptica]TDN99942.1 hypothetical protein DET52_106155 [Sunxiuqinia elliptica]TDO57134.1 hypothetical protein DET65_3719 [Sunxiuqinia elliptica]SFF21842.1 hypothetical protein SAMN05216283_103160 [Sunxiuqinia elliptica]|eukprot:GCRY01009845.1.p1 GENE.GCRY01009845.1~~GCRY01009845.1.p1  ORF type:complete len:151 (-),score=4.33 GCRY01009845.1:89-541(-)